MRRTYHDYGIISLEDKFIGISLGYDFTAEHEWGIDDIKRITGIPEPNKRNMGIKSRAITKTPNLYYNEGNHNGVKHAIMYTYPSWRNIEEAKMYIPTDLKNYVKRIIDTIKWDNSDEPNDPIICAWCSDGFGVAVYGNKETEYLRELYQAFQDINIVIGSININNKNPFSRAALSLIIKDRLPEEIKEEMYLSDKKVFDLIDYEKKIGMTKLKEKRKGVEYRELHYFTACSAKWIDYENKENREEQKKKLNTKYDIQYWINYSDDDNNYGWYTVEEIRMWLEGNKKLTEIRKA
jgi:hypothetical protein